MGGVELIIIGVAAVAIAAAVGAFTIAFRRAEPDSASLWPKRLERRARLADRSTPTMDVVVESPPEAEETPDEVEEVAAAVEEVAAEEVLAPITETQVIVEASPEEVGVTRRQFFNRSLAAMSVAWFGIMGIEILAFLWPKISGGFGSDVDAGNAADIVPEMTDAAGLITPAFIPDARAYVVPAPLKMSEQFAGKDVEAGGLMALYQRCVHLGCRVPWCDDSQGFECPCHGSKYNSIGEYFAGPAPRNLDRFAVHISEDGRLIIRTGVIVESPRAIAQSVSYPQGPSCI
ncbi:MAG: Rieske 2Fe-2S domain-containing protein [bacterium]|nr:Rieske 2Fe-2S domain-containing protein [bacterium]MDE0500167.1 Rieske 2Fe-2S domain-containing protein [bacterium]